jgi:hypothetical protein
MMADLTPEQREKLEAIVAGRESPRSNSNGNAASHGQPHWPEPLGEAAFHGLAGDIVRVIEPHTEADRATRGRTLRVNTQDWRVD